MLVHLAGACGEGIRRRLTTGDRRRRFGLKRLKTGEALLPRGRFPLGDAADLVTKIRLAKQTGVQLVSMLDLSAASAADRVYGEVKELILTNAIAGGELISEGEVAQRCEVSRTPVREAFLRLQAEGWMRLYPKRGALVLPVTDTEARDVVDARILIETHAVRTVVASGRVTGELIANLRRNVALHANVDADDIATFARLDAEFHQFIVSAGHNGVLADFYLGLAERQRRMTTASVHREPTVTPRIIAEHTALADSIERCDADEFATLLVDHVAGVHRIDDVHAVHVQAGTASMTSALEGQQ